jgi:hypothetical protein
MQNWSEIGSGLEQLGSELAKVWSSAVPFGLPFPDNEFEKRCDDWMDQLLSMRPPISEVPAVIRPWIFARLCFGIRAAKQFESVEESGAKALAWDVAAKFLLVEHWRNHGRQFWLSLGQDSFAA